MKWDGKLSERRYAIFSSVFGNYMIVVKGNDLRTAEKWGGFVSWVGGIKKAEIRRIR